MFVCLNRIWPSMDDHRRIYVPLGYGVFTTDFPIDAVSIISIGPMYRFLLYFITLSDEKSEDKRFTDERGEGRKPASTNATKSSNLF